MKKNICFSSLWAIFGKKILIYRGLFLGTKSIVANILDKTLCVVCTCNLLLYYTTIMVLLSMKRKNKQTKQYMHTQVGSDQPVHQGLDFYV